MIVFNTFTNYQRVKKLPEIDILIWTCCLIRYRAFGYTTKLYCTQKDIEFLKQWRLYDLYDEIDTTLFEDNEMLNRIDNSHFWSTRKIEAMYHQLNVLNEPVIYTDVDIIMRRPFDLSHDALVWSPEEWNTNEGQVYVPWRNLSKPVGYKMPKYILDTKDAYNCGVWWFRDKEVFNEYRRQYYAFCLDNPCKIKLHKKRGDEVEDLITNNSVWACNAEQRILKAVLTNANQDVACVMPERKKGWSIQGVHYFFYRISWKYLHDDEWAPAPDALPMLNLTVVECMLTIKDFDKGLFGFWNSRDIVRGWDEVDAKNKVWKLDRYE